MGFIAGLLVGAIAGAAAGLLATPKTGQQNRRFIEEQFPELAARAPELIESIRDNAAKRIEAGKDAFRQGVVESRQVLRRQLEQAQRAEGSLTGASGSGRPNEPSVR